MMKTLLTNLRLCAALLLLCSCWYPAVIWAVGRVALPAQAEGSLIRRDGHVVGSALIGQDFTSPRYFLGRPSTTTPEYNAAASGASNWGPSNPALLHRMQDEATSASQLDDISTSSVAFDRVTASGSGLDPDITPENAAQQVARVARERQLPPNAVRDLLARHTEAPLLGILGPPKVNVLRLNLALDELTSQVRTRVTGV